LAIVVIPHEEIDGDGMTFQGRWNQTRAHPLLSTERDARLVPERVEGVRFEEAAKGLLR
jgi:hypothetical protein